MSPRAGDIPLPPERFQVARRSRQRARVQCVTGSLVFLPEFGEYAVVFESRGVARGLTTGGYVAQEPPHDFAAACLRQCIREAHIVGPRERTDILYHVRLQLLLQ